MKNKIKTFIFILTALILCSWYDPILDVFTNAATATVDVANDWIVFWDVTDGKKKKAHPNAFGGDNLGNHTATTHLNMDGSDIFDARRIYTDSITSNTLISLATNTLQLGANNSVGMHFTTSNNVGINTTSPNAAFKLDVNGASLSQGMIRSRGQGAISSLTSAQFQTFNSLTSGAWVIHHEDDNDLVFNFSGPGNDALKLNGITNTTLFDVEKSLTITTTASTAITRSKVFYDLAITGTATADLSLAPDDSKFTFFNKDLPAGATVTIALAGATWYNGIVAILAPGESTNAHLLGGVLYPY